MEHDTKLHCQQITITQLLTLKRYELPSQEYFDQFLDRLRERLTLESHPDEDPAT
jgi:hypothetical protein